MFMKFLRLNRSFTSKSPQTLFCKVNLALLGPLDCDIQRTNENAFKSEETVSL